MGVGEAFWWLEMDREETAEILSLTHSATNAQA